ncbi:MAG: endolytic transglycosylase MltG, partial [Rhodobacteraceae bacterium]|nr:endolytic transglycosylase MltG [Paracoccaceae bacterium]
KRVSRDLLSVRAIDNDTIFRLGADYKEKSEKLKAGSFLIPAAASMDEIAELVTRSGASTCGTEIVYRIGVTRTSVQVRELDPKTNRFDKKAEFNPADETAPEIFERAKALNDTRFRVLMAEGVTSWQVREVLMAIDRLTGDLAAVPKEGALAPDSYEIRLGETRQAVIERMQAAQDIILKNAWKNRVKDLPLKSPDEALILASIVEKETGLPTERRQVASVFINRLNRSIRLQTDPTVIYGITKGEKTLGRGLRRSELDRKTPWNTYRINGLPPTPIANPGRASIEAVLDPDDTNFLFFVADGTGGHSFAKTLKEHNANVRKWREIEAGKAQK